MSFSINTNVTSLQAQAALAASSKFQSQTINEVTTGLRIVNSGDDAAGLAVANGMRSDQAVLTQGLRNATDGLSTLQTIDGGMNNISLLLDRARTLATQSASGTFTGDRGVLNNEFQSVLTEIDRQSTAIGMNTGGQFAKSMSVFIGGGKGTSATGVIANGSIGLDLSKSTVDTQSLGMKGFTAGHQVASGTPDTGLYDLSSGNTTSGTAAIITANGGGGVSANFTLSGGGFADTAALGQVSLSVNLSSVTDSASLVTAINNSIQAAAATGNSAFKAAGIVAEIHTGSDGHQQLEFASSSTSFQVNATNAMANALMGNMTGNTGGSASGITNAIGQATTAANSFVSSGTQQITGAFTTLGATDTQVLTFSAPDSTGAPQTTQVTLAATSTAAQAAKAINAQLQSTDNAALKSIVAVADAAGGGITFSNASSASFTVGFGASATGFQDAADLNKIVTSGNVGTGGTADISNQTSAESAVSALANAVTTLGTAQANVGKGENTFNYAMNLATSQSTNLAASESNIRDADLSTEAANLTKAQILIQAGTAALAQANSAPQAILSLLKG